MGLHSAEIIGSFHATKAAQVHGSSQNIQQKVLPGRRACFAKMYRCTPWRAAPPLARETPHHLPPSHILLGSPEPKCYVIPKATVEIFPSLRRHVLSSAGTEAVDRSPYRCFWRGVHLQDPNGVAWLGALDITGLCVIAMTQGHPFLSCS